MSNPAVQNKAWAFIGTRTNHGTGGVNMGSYFKPLRRKIGVFTLFLTIICIDGWSSSYYAFHELRIPTSRYGQFQILSLRGNIRIENVQSIEPNSFYRGTRSTLLVTVPHATVTVPLIVATSFLLLSRPRQTRVPPPANDNRTF